MSGTDLSTHPVHLGLGASIEVEPAFTGDMAWYQGYLERHETDGAEARLVSMFTFHTPWESWEMHPHGSELVLCTAGRLTLIQERPDGARARVELGPGEFAINEPGTWHTADVEGSATAVFVTAGLGTQTRPR
jgi:quercetin dioxygenase-like cupin family protein